MSDHKTMYRNAMLGLSLGIGFVLALVLEPVGLPVGSLWWAGLPTALLGTVPVAAGVGLGLVVMVLPGFGMLRLIPLRVHGVAEEFVAAVVVSVLTVGALGSVLIAFGVMSRGRLALVILVPCILGLKPVIAWAKRVAGLHRLLILGFGILSVPWVWLALQQGNPPARTFQWWYWDLGRYLTEAQGIPSWVSEYGTQVRWLPDYIIFNIVSEAYGGFGAIVPDASLMQVWKVAAVVIGLPIAYLVFRLWLGRSASFVSLILLAASTLWSQKFNAYKPEAIGLVIGLASVWLLVRGLRSRRADLVLLAGAGIGLDLAIHGVAAAVLGLMLLAAALAEIAVSHRGRWRDLAVLVSAGVLTGVLVVSVGVALQGRASVVGDAFNPEFEEGADPTWEFLQLSNGRREPNPRPSLTEQIEASLARLETPWGTALPVNVASPWFAIPTAIGFIALAALGGTRGRTGQLALVIFVVFLVGSALFFALSFDTYVPRYTGLSRMRRYAPFAVSLAIGFAFEGYRLLLNRLKAIDGLATGDLAGVLTLGFALALGVAILLQTYQTMPAVSSVGQESIQALELFSSPGDRVLSNATTRGTLEHLTGRDALLEGRQPLIEDPDFLNHTNETLKAAIEFFGSPDGDPFAVDRDVRWILIADSSADLGAERKYGGTVELFRQVPELQEVWSAKGMALFRTEAVADVQRFGPVETYRRSWVVGIIIIVVGLLFAVLVARRFGWVDRAPTSQVHIV